VGLVAHCRFPGAAGLQTCRLSSDMGFVCSLSSFLPSSQWIIQKSKTVLFGRSPFGCKVIFEVFLNTMVSGKTSISIL
jgi:hypothetical protein